MTTTADKPAANNTPVPRQRAPHVGDLPRGGVEVVDLPADLGQAKAKPARPTTLSEAAPWLAKPFRQQDVELKPGAMTRDRTRALGMPYADMRIYFFRLDKICGVENWSTSYTATDRGLVCALTIFGVTKSATGDYPRDSGDENPITSAEAQAFKRACAAFGLGRYLYALPQVWGDYDQEKKRLVDPAAMVSQMYHQAAIVNGVNE
jgi:hypothetical protein